MIQLNKSYPTKINGHTLFIAEGYISELHLLAKHFPSREKFWFAVNKRGELTCSVQKPTQIRTGWMPSDEGEVSLGYEGTISTMVHCGRVCEFGENEQSLWGSMVTEVRLHTWLEVFPDYKEDE